MTFIIKLRGTRTAPIAAEYRCPVHGRFTATVERDEDGDPPAEMKCQVWLEPTPEQAATVGHGHPTTYCGEWSPWTISAPTCRVKIAEVVRGKSDEMPPWVWDGSKLADDGDVDAFHTSRAKYWDEQLDKKVRKAVS